MLAQRTAYFKSHPQAPTLRRPHLDIGYEGQAQQLQHAAPARPPARVTVDF